MIHRAIIEKEGGVERENNSAMGGKEIAEIGK